LVLVGLWCGVQRRAPPPPGPPLAGGELVLRTAGDWGAGSCGWVFSEFNARPRGRFVGGRPQTSSWRVVFDGSSGRRGCWPVVAFCHAALGVGRFVVWRPETCPAPPWPPPRRGGTVLRTAGCLGALVERETRWETVGIGVAGECRLRWLVSDCRVSVPRTPSGIRAPPTIRHPQSSRATHGSPPGRDRPAF